MHIGILTADYTVKPILRDHSKLSLNAGQKYFKMLKGDHSAILSTFIKLPFVIKILFCLKTCFTVLTTHMYFLFCGVRRLIFFIKVKFFHN